MGHCHNGQSLAALNPVGGMDQRPLPCLGGARLHNNLHDEASDPSPEVSNLQSPDDHVEPTDHQRQQVLAPRAP